MPDELEKYKPVPPSLGQTFEVDETLPDNELAFNILKNLVKAIKFQDVIFLTIGKMLKIIKDRSLYKTLDFENFSQFLASEEVSFSREKAFMYIRIYEHYSEFLEMDEEVMRNISVVRLSLMLPTLKKIPNKEDQLKKIEEMKSLRYNDFIMETKKASDNDKPTMHYSQELSKWVIYYWVDRTQLIDKGAFHVEN